MGAVVGGNFVMGGDGAGGEGGGGAGGAGGHFEWVKTGFKDVEAHMKNHAYLDLKAAQNMMKREQDRLSKQKARGGRRK